MIKLNKKVATKVYSKTVVKYYDTEIVSFDDKTITLNSGGWFTLTTKNRMNQTASQFGLDYYVFQKDGEWFVNFKNGVVASYHDGMVIKR